MRPDRLPTTPDFEGWFAERFQIEAALAQVEGSERNPLLDRLYELERLILETPSSDVCAMRAKARVLAWLMEMEQADGLPAIRHIRDYLEQQQ